VTKTNIPVNQYPPLEGPEAESGGSFLGHIWASIAATIALGAVCCVAYPFVVWLIAQTVFPIQANGSLVTKDGTLTSDDSQAVGSYLIGQQFSLPGYFHPRPSAANNAAGASFSSTGGYDPTASGGTNLGPLSDELINGATTQPSAPAATQPTAQASSTTQPAATQAVAAATSPASQPAEVLTFDGVRLRTLHYAMDNGITFKLYTTSQDDGRHLDEVPLSKYLNADGTLNDTALVDAFPHPESDAPDKKPLVATDFTDSSGKPVAIPGDAVTSSGSGLDPHISPENAAFQIARVAKARNITPDQVQALIDAHTDQPGLGFLGDPGVNVLMLNIALDAKYPLPPPPVTQPAATTQPARS
jgi:K+-transporting ATPase ATPase C chain